MNGTLSLLDELETTLASGSSSRGDRDPDQRHRSLHQRRPALFRGPDRRVRRRHGAADGQDRSQGAGQARPAPGADRQRSLQRHPLARQRRRHRSRAPGADPVGTAQRAHARRHRQQQEPAAPLRHHPARRAQRSRDRHPGRARRPRRGACGGEEPRRPLLRCRLPRPGQPLERRRCAGERSRHAQRHPATAFPDASRKGLERGARAPGCREPAS